MAESCADVGRRLGPYELLEKLGKGGMAEVYVGRRAGPHGFAKKVAVKRILPHLSGDPRFLAMFSDEARVSAQLSHPNIVQVLDFGESDGQAFMAMEFVDGVSVAWLLRSAAARAERVPLAAAVFITHEVLKGLAFAHSARDEAGTPLRIIHRDVSPGNILVGRSGEVKITDFGIVRSAVVARRTHPGEVKGKLGYMSPEQVVGQDVDPRSDLFSVGIILAELLLLRPLFSGKNELEILTRTHEADISVLERHAGGIPREIMALLRRALARRRLDRFQSADEFLEALRQVAHVLGIDLNEADLVPWLSRFNLLSNRSGTHEATRPNAAQLASAPKPAEPLPGASLRRPPPPRRPTPPALRAPPTKLPEQRVRRFELRMRDGSTLGPFSLGNLVELFVTGRAPKNALVSEDGQAPVPATEIPILSGIARRRTFSFGLRFDDKRQKELRRPELPALFYTLVLRRETGLLVVRDGSREKKVYFEEGVPVLVASTLASELLGAWLRARGLITESDVERALLRACETDTALGEAFVGLGLLGPAALESELMAQMEARLFELFEWRSGRLWYVRGERSDASARNPAKLPLALVTKAIRHAFSEAELTTMTAGYDEAPLDVVTRAVPSALGLTSVEYRVVELIAQGERPLAAVRALVSRSEASVAEARRGLYVALCSGLVRPKASR